MDETLQIKEELLSLYKEIKNYIPNEKLPTGRTKNIENPNNIDSLTLISYIKDAISLLINDEFQNNTNTKNNCNIQSQSELFNNKNINDIIRDYLQLENQLIKLENDNKYYIKYYLHYKIQKEVLEMKLNAYMSLEDEYEELKEKVKYENGKFLENDRKDNEIIILRQENSSLKKDIVKLENLNKSIEDKNKEYQKKIKNYEKDIGIFKNKIINLEKILKDNNYKQIFFQKDRNNSCVDLGIKNYETGFEKLDNSHKIYINNNYNNIKNLKSFYPNTLNCKNKKIINFNSPKNDIIHIENNKNTNNTNNNIFSSTFSKINNFNIKKIKIPIKNGFNDFKNRRNNSINIIRVEKDDNKSLSLNKNPQDRNNKDNFLFQSKNKIKNLNKIFNSKQKTVSPLSCKSSVKQVQKYIYKNSFQNVNNNLFYKLKDTSSKQ